jgi:hypothetical protein
MKISMERGWERAIALVRSNGDVLAVLAGLFFFLPGFAGVFFISQQPQIDPGMGAEEALKSVEAYFVSILPYLLVVMVVDTIGRLAMLVLFTDRGRPTVGEALKRGALGLLPYILTSLLVALALAALSVILVVAPARIGVPVVVLLTGPLVIALALYVTIKLSLAAAVIVAEGISNPLALIRRSWQLTKGNSLRLLLFYLLLGLPYLVVAMLAQGLFGTLGAIAGGEHGQLFVGGAATALVGAAWGTLTAAIIAALYEQLSGRSDIDAARAFE